MTADDKDGLLSALSLAPATSGAPEAPRSEAAALTPEEPRPAPPSAAAGDEIARYLRTQFLERVAHDIRSPAGLAFGTLDELAKAGLTDEQLALSAMARRALRRLLRLAERLTLLSEIESGHGEPTRARADLRELAALTLREAEEVDGRKAVKAEAELPQEALWALVDPRWLRVALGEVLGNAMRHAASRVRLSARRAPGGIELRIEDDGIGLDMTEPESLLRRFPPGTPVRGMGVSLSLAADVLRLHGGTFTLTHSRLPLGRRGGPGAAFVLLVPSEGA